MRRFSLALPLLVVVACTDGGGRWSPSDPAAFDLRMFDADRLAQLPPGDRAYVQGHALGVYLYGKTLPTYVGRKGYEYQPGGSAEQARVGYVWTDLMRATSGGTDGMGIIYDHGDDVHGGDEGDGGDDVGTDDDGDFGDGGDGGDDDGDFGDGDDGGGDDDPWVDEDCETFLDPAAFDARGLALEMQPRQVLGDDVAADHEQRFWRGVADALSMEDLGEDTDHSEVEYLKDDVQDYGMCEHSPLVIDLAGDGVALSGVRDGVAFDLRQRGLPVRTAWPQADDALLVLDRDGDGLITSGGELFGSSRRAGGTRFANGFESLAALDDNRDGMVDALDRRFAELRLWRDDRRDGISEPGELTDLVSAGVLAIDLGYARLDRRDRFGNRLVEHGVFVRASDGGAAIGEVVDAWFRYRSLP